MLQTIFKTLENSGCSQDAKEIILASLSKGTRGQYNYHLRNFEIFCEQQNYNANSLTVSVGIDFLTDRFKSGLSYSSINTARSALSQFISFIDSPAAFGSHPLVSKFMKGVYKLRPPNPRYDSIWDVSPLLQYLASVVGNDLQSLTLKCCTLMALTSGQRVQTLTNLSLAFMIKSTDRITFHVDNILKTSKPGKSTSLEVKAYKNDHRICPFTCLTQYLLMTEDLRSSDKLFITYLKPHKPASSQSISRWIRTSMQSAGIETSFGAHSTRHASTSKASDLNVPIDQILTKAGWSSHHTFAQFYRRPIMEENTFADAILKN